MFNDVSDFLIMVVLLALVSPVLGGGSCQGNAMGTVRDAHTGIRGAFVRADSFIAPRFGAAGDDCIAEAQAAGLTGQEGSDASDECMSTWLELDRAISATREGMAELEVVYDEIERGGDDASWQRIARSVLTHGRQVVRLLDEIDIDGADEVISAMRRALDQICALVGCEGGT